MIDIEETQKRLLCMALEIIKILEKNNIDYFIAYGTLLGAVRHQGFIPWDDDFDIMLFEDSYNRAIEALEEDLPYNLFVESKKTEPNFFHAWCRVKDKNSIAKSILYEQDNIYKSQGLTVDLFKLNKMSIKKVKAFRRSEYKKYLERRRSVNSISEIDYLLKLKRVNEIKCFSDFSKQEKEVYVALESNVVLSKADIFPMKTILFEKYSFKCPNAPHDILKKIYGDYMRLPNVLERKKHYSSVKILKNN